MACHLLLLLLLLLLLTHVDCSNLIQIRNRLPSQLNLTYLFSTDIVPQEQDIVPQEQNKTLQHLSVEGDGNGEIPVTEGVKFAVACYMYVEVVTYGVPKKFRKRVLLYDEEDPLFGKGDVVWQVHDVGLFLNKRRQPILIWEDSEDSFPPRKQQQHTQHHYTQMGSLEQDLIHQLEQHTSTFSYSPALHHQSHSAQPFHSTVQQQQQQQQQQQSPMGFPPILDSPNYHGTVYSSSQQQQHQYNP